MTSTSLRALKINSVWLIEPAGRIGQIFPSRNACGSEGVCCINVSKQIEITSDISSGFLNYCQFKDSNSHRVNLRL